jgi:DNA-directed RNA polymerase subunit RPC12/RpoP
MQEIDPEVQAGFEAFRTWYAGADPILQLISIIVGCIFVGFIAYGVFYILIQIVKGIFWLIGTIMKAIFFGYAVMIYTMITIFIKLPITALSKGNVDAMFKEFEYNVEDFAHKVFGSEEKKDSVKKNDTYTVEVPFNPSPVDPKVSIPKTIISAKVVQPASSIVYYCTGCGQPFTARMQSLLSQRTKVFCEHCGEAFALENNLPRPLNTEVQ